MAISSQKALQLIEGHLAEPSRRGQSSRLPALLRQCTFCQSDSQVCMQGSAGPPTHSETWGKITEPKQSHLLSGLEKPPLQGPH